tara:strand:+ start:20875 stop:21903 length:1029 start_codon:yes stop_codon:yes gene_type:complete
MNKILIILTGGTIGSVKKGNIIDISKKNFLKKFLNNDVIYKIIQPINILSENAVPENWNEIIKCVEKNWEKDFSGIIITHGTDTLSYSASAISQYFYNFFKPVLFVSSDKPLNEKKANGRDNLNAAINFILKVKLPGTYVAYKNPNDNYVSFFLGSRVKQINSFDNKLNSKISNYFCYFKNKKFFFNKKENPSIQDIKKNCKKKELNKNFRFSNKILIINPFPGLNYNYINFKKEKPKAILQTLYHSGTACTQKNFKFSTSIEEFIKIYKKNISFYITPITSKNKTIYKSLKTLLNLGVISIKDVTVETAYAKLCLAYKTFKSKKKIGNFLKKNNFFEKINF